MNAKYIIIENEHGLPYPVVFPEMIQHIDMAHKLVDDLSQIASAGFCTFHPNDDSNNPITVDCFGKSVSLKKDARPDEDALYIRRILF